MSGAKKRFFYWKMGLTEWLLIVGAAFFSLSIWGKQETFDFISQALDFHQRKALSWTTVVATVLYMIYWVRVWRIYANEPFDEEDWFCVKRFLLATSLIIVELWGCLLLSGTEIPRYIWFQLCQMFGYGYYSHRALGIIIVIALLALGNIFIITRWAIAALDRSVN